MPSPPELGHREDKLQQAFQRPWFASSKEDNFPA